MNAILRRSRKPCMAPRLFRVLAIALLLTLGPASNLSAANPPGYVRVLSDADEAVYRDMFAAAAAGDREKVLALSTQVKDKSLLGHVAAKGFLSPKTVASFDELKSWLKAHSDYPEAARIHLLASRKDPARARELKDPPRRIIRGAGDDDADSNVGFTSPQAEAISKKLRGLIAARKMQDAAKYLESAEMRTQLSKAD